MTAKEVRNFYSPLIVEYINKNKKWLTTEEICTKFNLNIMQVYPLLRNLCDNYYIKRKFENRQSRWGNLTLK